MHCVCEGTLPPRNIFLHFTTKVNVNRLRANCIPMHTFRSINSTNRKMKISCANEVEFHKFGRNPTTLNLVYPSEVAPIELANLKLHRSRLEFFVNHHAYLDRAARSMPKLILIFQCT